MALVLVLGFLVIISALAVAFFASVTTELRASRNFQSNVNTRQLQDSVVNIVEGQIRQATYPTVNNTAILNTAWASQPGMITTFGTTTGLASSSVLNYYKLYSSKNMTVAGGTSSTLPSDLIGDYSPTWNANPALYTDLNAPVLTQDPNSPNNPSATIPRFPIIDPRAYYIPPTGTISAAAGTTSTSLVEGFSYGNTGSAGVVNETVVDTTGGNGARLPMPVSWIYILKDGSLTSPTGIGSGANATVQASWTGPNATNIPSAANPIVGRVAFWTDDDTSKVNVNTAGGAVWSSSSTAGGYTADQWAGSYWDTPRVTSLFDEGQVYGPPMPPGTYQTGSSGNGGTPVLGEGGLATTQMLQNEFQRYPGHPAQTSLALIFNSIMTAEQMYMITPRLVYNGFNNGSTGGTANTSEEGTNRLHLAPSTPIAGAATTGVTANVALPIRYDRLYDSVDELIFAYNSTNGENGPRRTNVNFVNLAATPNYNTSNVNTATQFTPGLLDRLRFFVTAYNRAPELNLYGHPRVCVWPIRSQQWADDTNPLTSGINAYDSLSLFCSTIGPMVYNYPGYNSDPPTPVNSLGSNTNVSAPPFRYSFFRREPSAVIVNPNNSDISLGRNQQLLQYLQQLTTQDVPGFTAQPGQNFQAKYTTANMDETLVEMFDYIRCANLYDTTVTNTKAAPGNTNPHPFSPTGIVMPSVGTLNSGNQLGMGRFPTICEASIVFYYAGSDKTSAAANPVVGTLNTAANLYSSQGLAASLEKTEASGVLVIIPPMTPYLHPAASPSTLSQVPTVRKMRAAMIFSTFNPMQGYGPVQNPAPNFPLSGNVNPLVTFAVSGLNSFGIATGSSGDAVSGQPFPVDSGTISLGAVSGNFWGGRNFGGFEGFAHTLYDGIYQGSTLTQQVYPLSTPASTPMTVAVGPLANPTIASNTTADYEEAVVPNFIFKGGTVNVVVNFGGAQIQKMAITFPPTTLLAPRGDDIVDAEPFAVKNTGTPTVPILTPTPTANNGPVLANTIAPADLTTTPVNVNGYSFTTGGSQPYGQLRRWYWQMDRGSFDPNAGRTIPGRASTAPASWSQTGIWARTVGMARDFQQRINWVLNAPTEGSNSDDPVATSSSSPGSILGWAGGRWRQIIQPGDTVRSVIFCNMAPASTGSVQTTSGDLRLAAVTGSILAPTAGSTSTAPGFYPHPDYGTSTLASPMRQACLLRMADSELYYNYAGDTFFNAAANATSGLGPSGYSGAQATTWYSNQNPFGNHVALTASNSLPNKSFQPAACVGDLPRSLHASTLSTPVMINGVVRQDGKAGDLDTGVGSYPDGPYFNKQDEGNAIFVYLNAYTGVVSYPIPYFGSGNYAAPGSAFDSPNRQMPSPVMMGSLLSQASPTATIPHGWETLCFCPNPAGINHNGNVSLPKDHLLLDLFQMPVVQPYPISEPFSTAGKVNLNYQIQPFDYIQRSTALRAALATERISVMGSNTTVSLTGQITNPPGIAASTSSQMYWAYKQQSTNSTTGTSNLMVTDMRKIIDRDQTVNEISAYIAQYGVFRSPSQICEIYLVPTGLGWTVAPTPTTSLSQAQSQAQTFWTNTGDLTGDNLREKPYADIYPRLTTKSNTFTIHMKVQALRQQPHPSVSSGSSPYATWDESKDAVLGEYRGSATIERYIDPADRRFNPTDSLTEQNSDFVNPDNTSSSNSLERLYRFRTVNTKKFSP